MSRTTAKEAKGLRLSGTIEARVKRLVPKDNPKTESVTYTVNDENGNTYYLQDYSPESYFEVGESIDVPVYIKPYVGNKGIAYTINLKKARKSSRGEAF